MLPCHSQAAMHEPTHFLRKDGESLDSSNMMCKGLSIVDGR